MALYESVASLFGFQIKRPEEKPLLPKDEEKLTAFANDGNNDGAVVINAGGVAATFVDLDGACKTEAELVSKYREMTLSAELFSAVDEITNEAIVVDENNKTIEIVLDDIPLSDSSKKIIENEFLEVVRLLDFEKNSYQIFRRWYIDGRLYYNVIVDKSSPELGVLEMRYVDPRKIRKVREISKRNSDKQLDKQGITLTKTVNEYYIYNDKGLTTLKNPTTTGSSGYGSQGLRISKDAIVHVNSGLTDENGLMVLSYLHPAIKPLNQLRSMEDSTLIYRISRAPERRIFYVDVSNMPKLKAEQQIRDMMARQKSKIVYDAADGSIRSENKFATMIEDYWLPRRDGGKGTEISTLPGGQNLGEMEDVLYFQKKLYKSLMIPYSRIEGDQGMFNNRSSEITRDEIKFTKFIGRLRTSFSDLFLLTLEKQLLLKGYFTPEEWKQLSYLIRFRFLKDESFAEIKNLEIQSNRLDVLSEWEPFVGKYVSHKYIQNKILSMTDEEITDQRKQILEELSDPIYNQPIMQQEDNV